MTMLIMDGCDNYASHDDVKRRWPGGNTTASISGQTTGGRFGGGRLNILNDDVECSRMLVPDGSIRRALYTGFAFDYTTESQSDRLFQWHENGTQQVIMQHNPPNRRINFYQGSFATLLGSTTTGLMNLAGQWNWVETFIAFSSAVSEAYLECRINGVVALQVSGISTITAGTGCNQLALYGQVSNTWYDDIMVWDDLGTDNNDWLGDSRIDLIHPEADAGDTASPPWHNPVDTDENYKQVDETYRDVSTYVEANALGQKDMYSCGDMPVPNPDKIHAVQAFHVSKNPNAGNRKLHQIIGHNGSENRSDVKYQNQQWLYHDHIAEVNPSTGLAWTEAEVNELVVGMELGE